MKRLGIVAYGTAAIGFIFSVNTSFMYLGAYMSKKIFQAFSFTFYTLSVCGTLIKPTEQHYTAKSKREVL